LSKSEFLKQGNSSWRMIFDEPRAGDWWSGILVQVDILVAGYLGILVLSIGRFTVLAAGWYTGG
jgi:hypothetical protein